MTATPLMNLRERVRNMHPRTRKAQLNTVAGLFIKGMGLLISLMLVPLTIDYLSKNIYGTWLAISSIITMLMFFDIGIGNGLRNKLSEAVSRQDIELARSYISTAYALFSGLQGFLILLFAIIYRLIPWKRVFNTSLDEKLLQQVVFVLAISMAIKLVLDILTYVLIALQESGIASLLTLLSNILVLSGTYLLTKTTTDNILYLSLLTAVSPILILTASSFFFFMGRLKYYRPSLRYISKKYIKDLLSLGYQFFFIQIAVIILFYSDNLIITQLFGAAAVTTYNVAFRYFNTISVVFSIALAPLWSAFTEAYVKNDFSWMKQTLQRLQSLWLILLFVVIIMVLVAQHVYFAWLGTRVQVPVALTVCMALFTLITCWNNIVVIVANGLGKVRLQLFYSLISASVNIPLALYLGKKTDLGSAGVILASSISLLIGTVLATLQAKKLLSGTASGIWNK